MVLFSLQILAFGWFMLFLIIRLIGGFGNINPSLVGGPDSASLSSNPFLSSWIAFFNTIKYPPDLAYSSLFITVNHLLLAMFFLLPTGPDVNKYVSAIIINGPLLDFGRSALFFYVIHFYLYFGGAWIIGKLYPELKNPNGGFLEMNGWQFLITWLVGLVILWVMCRYYARFKASRGPDSIFRFF
jgi:glucan phosphoethanolaminetransferase (alkaline phosphatase superfamily)